MGNAISSIASFDQQYNPLAKYDPVSKMMVGLGGGGGGGGGAYIPQRQSTLTPEQMRSMGSQFQYRGAPPQMPQGMNVVPLWARQQQMNPQMMQQMQSQMRPTWDVNAYNPNQNMQMRQQQMQQQMQGTPYQNMGMFGAFNPYMPRQR